MCYNSNWTANTVGAHTWALYLLKKEVIYAVCEFTEGPAIAGPSHFVGIDHPCESHRKGSSVELGVRFVLTFDSIDIRLDGRHGCQFIVEEVVNDVDDFRAQGF